MSVEREMSLAEWCAKLPSLHLVNQELSTLNTQLAALAEQNGKMREALAECEQALDECRDYPVTLDLVIEALYLPDLMPSALNRIKAFQNGLGIFNLHAQVGGHQVGQASGVVHIVQDAHHIGRGKPPQGKYFFALLTGGAHHCFLLNGQLRGNFFLNGGNLGCEIWA